MNPFRPPSLLGFYLASGATRLSSTDFSTLSAGAVGSALPGGFSFARASDGYSVQTGTSALTVATIANNTPRAGRRLDAHDVGLVLEGAFTAEMLRSSAFATAPWNLHSGTRTASAANGPDGSSNTAFRIQTAANTDLGVGYYWLPTLTDGQRYVASLWMKGPAGGENGQLCVVNGGLTHGKGAPDAALSAAWQRYSLSLTAGTDTGTDLTTVFLWAGGYSRATNGTIATLTGGLAAGLRDAHIWGASCGPGAILTEYIPTVASAVTRAAERLYHSDVSRFVSGGRCQVYLKFRPKGALADYATDPYMWLTGSDYAKVEASTGKIVLSIGGVTYKTPIGMSWSANDLLEVWLEAGSGATYARYRVNGGTSILLTLGTPPALAAITPGATIDVLCNGTSNVFTSWVYTVQAWAGSYEPTWAQMPSSSTLDVTVSVDRVQLSGRGTTGFGATPSHSANYRYTNLMAKWAITTDATSIDVALYTDNYSGGVPNNARIGIKDLGTDTWAYAQATGDDATGTITVALPGTGTRTIEVYNGLQSAWDGTWIRSVSPNNGSVFVVQDPPSPAGKTLLLIYGDSIVEQTTPAATVHEDCPIWKLRSQLSDTLVFAEAYGGRGVASDYSASDVFVRLGHDLRSAYDAAGVAASDVIVLIEVGTNDFNGASFGTVATFQTRYGQMLTAIRAALPSARIVCQTPINRTNTTNGSGQTLAQYRTAIVDAEAASGDGNTEVLDGSTLIDAAADDTYDGVHLDASGVTNYVTRLIAALGLT